MRFYRLNKLALAISLLSVTCLMAGLVGSFAHAQSNISGDIAGMVTDASGAVVPSAKVTVTSLATGEVKSVVSDKVGEFHFSLLEPGDYMVSVTATGFETRKQKVAVSAGRTTALEPHLAVGQATTTVEVGSQDIQTLDTTDAQISTSFNLADMQNMPNPGNDLTFVGQTTPGAIMNTQSGYGNFSIDGLPATSNTFTINGGYEGDPYLNISNSGATNLLLGNNEIDTVTVTANSFDAAFGGLGGAQVNEITRAGSNQIHGNLTYYWNGRVMNANSFFNKQNASPRSFDNANQWAGAIGGPLKKNKIFGFFNTEGTRIIIPEIGLVDAPSKAWQNVILGAATTDPVYAPYGNLAANGNSAEAGLYKAMFAYYNNAKNYSTGYIDPGGDPDVWVFNGQTGSFAKEWLITGRLDFDLTSKDTMFIHVKTDNGLQPTTANLLSSDFSAQSPQPSWEGQLVETHTFSPNLTNQYLMVGSYYRAQFTNTNATKLAGTLPFVVIPEGFVSGGDWGAYTIDGSTGYSGIIGDEDFAFPQGRMVTGYQFNDDLNWVKGKHTAKFGYAFRRDDITDYTSSEHTVAEAGGENVVLDQGDFAAGLSDEWVERFPQKPSRPVALYVEGFYAQDQWKTLSNLTLTFGLRVEHNSNPICVTNCISNFSQDFASLPTAQNSAYNSLMTSGRHQAYFQMQPIAYEPRIGFAYLPFGSGSKTTIRGGFGMFANYFPAQIMGNLVTNLPSVDRFTVLGAAYGDNITFDTTSNKGGHYQANVSNIALQSLFSQGGYYKNAAGTCPDSLSIYCATGGLFSRPTVVSVAHHISLPTYEEWNLAIEHEVARNTAVKLSYVGNHTYHEPVSYMPNAYDTVAAGKTGAIASLPAARPNSALGSVQQFYSAGVSNFNGLEAQLTSRLSWLTLQFNYEWGHALDDGSNGGFDAFGGDSIGQVNPKSLKQDYGNADYDVRQYISSSYVIRVPHFAGPRTLVDNWEVAGTIFHSTGYPFSVTDNTGKVTYGNVARAKQIDSNFNHHCGGESHTIGASKATPCNFASHFTHATDYGQQSRNQIYGPNYSDFDLDLAKGFQIPKWESAKVKVGVQFFNVFNHPNFNLPDFDVNDSTLGYLTSAVSTPTSVLGSFLGGDASPRLIQAKLSFVF